jgi:hypothetical protein
MLESNVGMKIMSESNIWMLRAHLFFRQPLLQGLQPFFLLVQNDVIITLEGPGTFGPHVVPEATLTVSEIRIVVVRHDPVDDGER